VFSGSLNPLAYVVQVAGDAHEYQVARSPSTAPKRPH
jgi:hypothetical protein